MGIAGTLGKGLVPQLAGWHPSMSSGFVHDGAAPGDRRRRTAAGRRRRAPTSSSPSSSGDVDKAVHEVIEDHVRYAGAQGFATNIGGLVTAALTIPANIAGLALIQCRLVASHRPPARLRPRRPAGPQRRSWPASSARTTVKSLVRKKKLPSTPMGMATAPTYDPHLDSVIAAEVTSELLTKVAGKRDRHHRRPAGCPSSAGWSARARTPTPPGRSAATPTASCAPHAAVDLQPDRREPVVVGGAAPAAASPGTTARGSRSSSSYAASSSRLQPPL